MSDLCTYEIEGTVWDEFCQIDDHIVPQTGDKRANRNYFQGDGCKKPRCGVTCISSNFIDGYSDSYVDQEREQGEYNRKSLVLEKDSLSHRKNSLFLTSSDSHSIRNVPGLISDNTKTSGHDFKNNNTDSIGSEFYANDPIQDEKSTSDHNHSYSYSLEDTPQTDNDLNFLDNFEDVDRMFRSCDSTFGLGASREDEFGWFSCPESNAMENMSGSHNLSKLIVSNDSALETSPVGSKESSWPLGTNEFASHLSIVNGTSRPDCKDEFMPKDQIHEYKLQSKHQNPSERKRKEQYFGNGSYISNLPSEVIQFPYGDASNQAFPYMDIQHQQQGSTCDSVSQEKQVHFSGDKLDDRCDVEGGRIVTPAELCSSNIQESLSMSPNLDDISPEAVSFCQLQHVTKQLDLRTKLCIRDGLYRLATSAEQRQNQENLNSSSGDERDASGTFMAEGANKCAGFMNVETDTNSVDRSIAHLLFTCP
ncbi:protein LNK1-like isoform X2 [Olea europaea var. sylvestris]|uniref:protein LNK1-like isoform X2 n=1 Tax=Olea europaea var. sylvestris TaxID=158386 RepID=UPI000C1D846B|nr:protein LNK1-like isoform X2 [Olea europaea var. sylvestris]